MTLAELKTLIQDFTQNDETVFVNTLNDLIKNAEDRIFKEVQMNAFRKNVTGNLTTGNRFLTAPSDFVLSFSLTVIDASGDNITLLKKHPTFIQAYTKDNTDSALRGVPKYYADFDAELSTAPSNGSTLTIAPVPDADYDVELHYLYKPNSLVTDTNGTWISENGRNALLYGSLVEAYTFMKGEQDLLNLYNQRYLEELSRLKNEFEGRGRRDEYRYDMLRSNVT